MADDGKHLGEGIRLILEELKDLKRESLKDFQSADEDRKQATEDRRRADSDRNALMTYIRKAGEADRLQRQDFKATLDALVRQNARPAETLERQGKRTDRALGEIRDLLRRGGNGRPPHNGNGHGKR